MHAPNTSLSLATLNGHQRWTLNPQVVAKGTADMPEDVRETLLWLDGYGRTKDLTLGEVGALLRKPNGTIYSKDTVYHVLTGREKSMSVFLRAVEIFRAGQGTVITSPKAFPFVKSGVAQTVWSYLDLVIEWGTMGVLIGDSHTGKTRSIAEYIKAHPELDFLYLQIPDGGHRGKVVAHLCDKRNVSNKFNTTSRELRLEKTITPKTVMVLEEIQQCAARLKAGSRISGERVDTIEYARRLHDVTHCPMLLTGTTEALAMLNGTGVAEIANKGIFDQTTNRALDPCILKHNPSARDLNAFAKCVGLEPANERMAKIQNHIVIKRKLKTWLSYLLAGSNIAKKANRPIHWDDVMQAIELFESEERKAVRELAGAK